VLASADPLPVLPVVGLGRELAGAIARLDARLPLDLLTVEPGARRA
jgi:hypothetical protein